MMSSTFPLQREHPLISPVVLLNEETICKQLLELTKKKNIEHIYFLMPEQRTYSDLVEEVAASASWAFKHIYAFPYPPPADEKEPSEWASESKIARHFHGIQHASRAATYIPVFANLYRRYNHEEALLLTEDDLKLIQIATLFHDAGREGDGEDLWDTDSALLLYFYLIGVRHTDFRKALLAAEAVANKDANEKNYLELVHDVDINRITWKKAYGRPKNIYQKLIHDADCLDIIRARPHFEAEYLDFYQCYARLYPRALDEMARLIMEARYIITKQGDAPNLHCISTKKDYEHSQAYRSQVAMIKNRKHFLQLLAPLYAEGKLLPKSQLEQDLLAPMEFDPAKPLSENNIHSAMHLGKVLARGIPVPSAYRKKVSATNMPDETLAEVDIRKAYRRSGVATRTSKPNNTLKEGNPARSVSLMGCGGTVFTSAGFLIFNPNFSAMRCISSVDCDSGYGKKRNSLEKNPLPCNPENMEKQFEDLLRKQKMGGSSRFFSTTKTYATHTEIEYDITHFDAIYYTNDPIFSNKFVIPHPASAILQAIYLQKTFEKMQEKKLPIIPYSTVCICNCTQVLENVDEDRIKQWWVSLCSAFMSQQIEKYDFWFFSASIDEIKVMSMYGTLTYSRAKKIVPADICYSEDLRHKINLEIELKRAGLIEKHKTYVLLDILDRCDDSVLQTIGFILEDPRFYLSLMNFPSLLEETAVKNQLLDELRSRLSLYEVLKEFDEIEKKEIRYYFKFDHLQFVKEKNSAELADEREKQRVYFYGDDIVVIYYLAMIVKADDVVESIKRDSLVQANQHLAVLTEKIKKGIALDNLHQDISDIFKFFRIFRIYEELKEATFDMVSHLFIAAMNSTVERKVCPLYRALIIALDNLHHLGKATFSFSYTREVLSSPAYPSFIQALKNYFIVSENFSFIPLDNRISVGTGEENEQEDYWQGSREVRVSKIGLFRSLFFSAERTDRAEQLALSFSC